jgi:hypothetical protein
MAAFVYPGVAVEAELSTGVWTNIYDDVAKSAPVRIAYGISGDGPTDCVAGTGECQFAMLNAANNWGRPLGFYSPRHARCRAGWGFGTGIRVRFFHNGTWRTKHRGKAWVIDPTPGLYRERTVGVVSYDAMRDIAEADIREVTVQFSASESDLATEILDALPAAAQPIARSIDTGVDSFPYAFHDIGPGTKALSLLKDVAVNSFSLIAMKGDGTFMLRSRSTRAASDSVFTFDNSMHGLSAPSSADQAYNIVRVTIHPVTVDAAATTVIWSATGSAPSIAPGETLVLWADYRDPSNTATLIGARDVVDPMVSGTDYAANSAANGSGLDIAASLNVSLDAFATTAKITITNNHATATAYFVNGAGVTTLQIRGKGLYDRGPQTFEASSAATITRTLELDLAYQSDASVAQSYATFVQAQYRDISNRIGEIEFLANASPEFLAQALDREPGDIITVTEPVTGIDRVDVVIQSVELTLEGGSVLRCRWGLAPAAPFKAWVLGVTGRTEMGETTVLGF